MQGRFEFGKDIAALRRFAHTLHGKEPP